MNNRCCQSVPVCFFHLVESESGSNGSYYSNDNDSLSVSSDMSETTLFADEEVKNILKYPAIISLEPVIERSKNPFFA